MSLPSYYSIYDSFVLDTNGNIGIGTAYPKSVIDITNRTDAIIIPSKDAVTEETETPAQPSTKVGVLRMNKAYGRFEKKQGANWGQTSVWQPVITSANPTKLQNVGMQTTVNGMLFELDSVWSFVGTDGTNYPCVSQFISQFQVILTRPNVFPASKSPYRIRVYNTEAAKDYILSTLLIDAGVGPTFTTPAGSLSNLSPNTAYNQGIVISAVDEVGGGVTSIAIDNGLVGSGLSGQYNNNSFTISGTTANVSNSTTYNFTAIAYDSGSNTSSRAYSFTIQPLIKVFSVTTGLFSAPGISGQDTRYNAPAITLPSDFNNLQSWDLKFYAYKNYSNFGFAYPDIGIKNAAGTVLANYGISGGTHLAHSIERLITAKTNPLGSANDSLNCYLKIFTYGNLVNCYFVLTIRYQP
jgi:hypothetical protein